MEMYLMNRLAISLEQLYAAVPTVLLELFDITWEASSLSCILGQELYKGVLLITSVLRAILHFLVYFFHFDPPTFDALQEMARIHLDPDAPSHQKDRLAFEHNIARLEADNLMLLRKNKEMSARIHSLETYALDMELSLAQQEEAFRQLLLGILACRRNVSLPRPVPRPRSPKLQLAVSLKLLDSNQIIDEITDVIHTKDGSPKLLMHLNANVITTMISANRHSEQAVGCWEDISQSFLIQLLMMRKVARTFSAEIKTKTHLTTLLLRGKQQQMQTMEWEHETTTKHLLIQMLTLRSQLSRLLLSCKSSSPGPARPLSFVRMITPRVSYDSLTAQLEELRLSEAQARAEKDSVVQSLSDVLDSDVLNKLRRSGLCHPVREEEPIKELVLALAFAWKMLRRKPPAVTKLLEVVPTSKVDKNAEITLREEQISTSRPGIPPDSVRARAFKLGPPTNSPFIPMQYSSRYRHIYDAHASINLDSHLSLIQTTNSQPYFPPGIPPMQVARSPILPSPENNIFGPPEPSLYSNLIQPPRATIMSRGGYSFGPYSEANLRPDGQVHHRSAIGYMGIPQHSYGPYNEASLLPEAQVHHRSAIGYMGIPQQIGSHTRDLDVEVSGMQKVPPRPFSST